MAKYPVKPGTVVKLPSHPVVAAAKKRSFRRKRIHNPEDQLAALRTRCRWLTLALIIAVAALLVVSGMMLWHLKFNNSGQLPDFSQLIPSVFE